VREAATVYFDRPGPTNTEAVLAAARRRICELGLRHVLVATCTGDTALRAAAAFSGLPALNLVAVAPPMGAPPISDQWMARYRDYIPAEELEAKMEHQPQGWTHRPISPNVKEELARLGAKIIRCQFPTALESSASDLYGGVTAGLLAHETVRALVGRGIYVCMVIANAAADLGAVPAGTEAMAIGGTKLGADSAVVLRPGYSTSFYDWRCGTHIVEIVAMPRSR